MNDTSNPDDRSEAAETNAPQNGDEQTPAPQNAAPLNADPHDGAAGLSAVMPSPAAGASEFLVVGLGASAGGIKALKTFFENTPAASGMAYVVILHLSPRHESKLAEVLQGSTQMPVTQVREAVRIEPDNVYVIPPNMNLAMNDGMITLYEFEHAQQRRATVDLFFRTLAENNDSRAIVCILSGTGANGSVGLRRVKEMGGAVFAQEPADAEYDPMPKNAIATGLVDEVLPVVRMPEQLIAYRDARLRVRVPTEDGELRRASHDSDEEALRDLLTQLRVRTGNDFVNYKRATVLRRIARRMSVRGVETIGEYADYTRRNPEELNALMRDLLISVTNFFRDKAAFEFLEARVVPQLFAHKGAGDQLRLWVAGCATGEEAYSMAMLLHEHAARLPYPPLIQIFASDIDEAAIHIAREGFYPESITGDVEPERLARFFAKTADGYRVKKDLRDSILFAAHNLAKDPPFSKIDLASCRNVLIYFNRTLQEQMLHLFHFALVPEGYLFLGASESTDGASNLFTLAEREQRVFRTRAVPRSLARVPEMPLGRSDATPMLAVEADAGRRQLFSADLHAQLIESYAPPSIVVNEDHNIVHISQRAGRFLHFTGGEPTYNLPKVVRPELRLELTTALYQAAQRNQQIETRSGIVNPDNTRTPLRIIVRPAPVANAGKFFLVLFDEERALAAERLLVPGVTEEEAPVALRLEEEIERLRDQLRATVERYETSLEEVRASNGELLSMNEELRSTSEELETSREELQSLNEELQTVNQELRIKIEEVTQTNNDLQNLIASTDVATLFLDRSLNITRFTPRARDLFNLIPGDIGRPLADITNRLDYPEIGADAGRVLAELRSVEREVASLDDKTYIARLLPYRTRDDRIGGVVLAFTDITERQRAEERLRESEERYRILFDSMDEGYFLADVVFDENDKPVDILYLDVNPSATRMVGSDFTGRRLRDIDPRYEEYWYEIFGEVARTGEDVRLERYAEPDEKWYGFYVFKVGSSDSRRVAAIFQDITDRKRIEQASLEPGERLRLFVENMPGAAVFVIDRDLRYTLAGGEALASAGRQPSDYEGRTVSQAVPPELAAQLETRLRGALRGEAFVEEREHGGRAFLTRGVPLADDGGEVYAVLVVSYDITERRQAEEALRDSEARFRAAFEQANVGIVQAGLDGRVLVPNPGFCKIIGYTEEEATRLSVRGITHPEDYDLDTEEWRRTVAGEVPGYSMEKRYLRKDGATVWVQLTSTLVRDAAGAPFYALAIVEDITERKQAAESLRRSRDELESRVRARTIELAEANAALERRMIEQQAEENARRELREQLLRQLVRAQEDERQRISRELHDHTGQQLTALALGLQRLKEMSENRQPTTELVERLRQIAAQIDRDIDRISGALRPTALDDLGLRAALAQHVAEWSREHNTPADFHSSGLDDERFEPQIETTLYRVAQEALTNVVKHAGASRVSVIVERKDDHLFLIVEDNGRGFDLPDGADGATRDGTRRLGLMGMRERVRLVGGTLDMESAPGAGTTVFVRVPVAPR